MAVTSYLVLTPFSGSGPGPALGTESTVIIDRDISGATVSPKTLLELTSYSLDVSQSLNIGSAGTGAGAGKVTFNPFSISKRVDLLTPVLFQRCAAGTPFAKLDLLVVKASGGTAHPRVFLQYTFKLAAVATIAYSHDDESPQESVTFGYGTLQVRYAPQNPDGSLGQVVSAGWNRVTNTADVTV